MLKIFKVLIVIFLLNVSCARNNYSNKCIAKELSLSLACSIIERINKGNFLKNILEDFRTKENIETKNEELIEKLKIGTAKGIEKGVEGIVEKIMLEEPIIKSILLYIIGQEEKTEN